VTLSRWKMGSGASCPVWVATVTLFEEGVGALGDPCATLTGELLGDRGMLRHGDGSLLPSPSSSANGGVPGQKKLIKLV